MTPKTEAEKAAEAKRVAKAQERLAKAKQKRDDDKAKADATFWATVQAALDNGELQQNQACEAIGYKREYVRRQLLEYKTAGGENSNG